MRGRGSSIAGGARKISITGISMGILSHSLSTPLILIQSLDSLPCRNLHKGYGTAEYAYYWESGKSGDGAPWAMVKM